MEQYFKVVYGGDCDTMDDSSYWHIESKFGLLCEGRYPIRFYDKEEAEMIANYLSKFFTKE